MRRREDPVAHGDGGRGLPTPQVLAVTHANRRLAGAELVQNPSAASAFLRRAELYPLFADPVAGKYSLGVVSGVQYERADDAM